MNVVAEPIANERVVTPAQFAEIVRVSRSAVTQARDSGRFSADTVTPQGWLRLDRALVEFFQNADPRGGGAKKSLTLEAAADRAPSVSYDTKDDDAEALAAAVPGALSPDHMQAKEGTLAYERIEMAKLKRRALESDMAERDGRLIAIDKLEAAVFEIARELRAVLKLLPEAADDLAQITDVEAMRKRLRALAVTVGKTAAEKFAALATRATNADADLTADEPDHDPVE